jgi:hypothetical protein
VQPPLLVLVPAAVAQLSHNLTLAVPYDFTDNDEASKAAVNLER